MGIRQGVVLLLFLALKIGVVAQTVYKTPTVKKYHTKGHYATSTPISLEDALKLGLEPCQVCKPTARKIDEISGLFDTEGQTVYRTPTGKKYHTSSHYPNSSPIALSDALKLGLGPCSICKPQPGSNSDTRSDIRIAEPSNTKTSTRSVQCRGTTKAGQRCKRVTTDPSGYCYQHKQ